MGFDSFEIVLKPRRVTARELGGMATGKASAIVNGRDLCGMDGPDVAALLPTDGPLPELSIARHQWAATGQPRTVPLVVGLAALERYDVDWWVTIGRDGDRVGWEVTPREGPGTTYSFNAKTYDAALWQSITDRSWEEPADALLRSLRERCRHDWLKTQGLVWRHCGATLQGTIWVSFRTSTDEVVDFKAAVNVSHPDREASRVAAELHAWAECGAPGPRSRWNEDPASLRNVHPYPDITAPGKM